MAAPREPSYDESPEDEPPPPDIDAGWAPGVDDEDYRFVRRRGDPITAPVAALDLLNQELDDIEDMGHELPAASDQVFIRAGQAGTTGPATGRKGRAEPDERQGRPGRLKLRRRSQDSP